MFIPGLAMFHTGGLLSRVCAHRIARKSPAPFATAREPIPSASCPGFPSVVFVMGKASRRCGDRRRVARIAGGAGLSKHSPAPFAAVRVLCLCEQAMRWCARNAWVREMTFQRRRCRVCNVTAAAGSRWMPRTECARQATHSLPFMDRWIR